MSDLLFTSERLFAYFLLFVCVCVCVLVSFLSLSLALRFSHILFIVVHAPDTVYMWVYVYERRSNEMDIAKIKNNNKNNDNNKQRKRTRGQVKKSIVRKLLEMPTSSIFSCSKWFSSCVSQSIHFSSKCEHIHLPIICNNNFNRKLSSIMAIAGNAAALAAWYIAARVLNVKSDLDFDGKETRLQ